VSLPALSIVVPFHNEGENVAALIMEITRVVEQLPAPVEVILVDDGSTDHTAAELTASAVSLANVRILRFRKNRGQGAALFAGMKTALAPIVITLDGDGQNDPADIPLLLGRLNDADMVVGIRTPRQDNWLRRTMATVANAVRSRFLGDGIQDTGCGLKAFRREVIEAFVPIKTLYSFMPALATASGFCVTERPVRHRPRLKGRSHYGLTVFLRGGLIDMLGVYWLCRRRMPRLSEARET